jgi:hypothetical protein
MARVDDGSEVGLPDGMVTADELRWTLTPRDHGDTRPELNSPPSASDERRPMTAADLVIEDLAAGEEAALARVAELETENEWLQDVVREAVSQLHAATVQGDRQATRLHALVHELRLALDETRTLRARLRSLEAHAA